MLQIDECLSMHSVLYNVRNIMLYTARKRYVTATAGEEVTLVCNSSVAKPVCWWYKDQRDEREVVVNGEVVNGNAVRMTLIGHDLVIHSVSANDTGVYACVEETGFGEHHKISLTVSGFKF